jgi:hypothetical protein
VDAVIDDLVNAHEYVFRTTLANSKDAIDEVLRQDSGVSFMRETIRPSFFYQLRIYFPGAWQRVEEYKSQLRKIIVMNLRRGKQEGIYRGDIDVMVASDLRLRQVVNVFQPELLSGHNLSADYLAGEFTLFYLHSITSDKGRELLRNYLQEMKTSKKLTQLT